MLEFGACDLQPTLNSLISFHISGFNPPHDIPMFIPHGEGTNTCTQWPMIQMLMLRQTHLPWVTNIPPYFTCTKLRTSWRGAPLLSPCSFQTQDSTDQGTSSTWHRVWHLNVLNQLCVFLQTTILLKCPTDPKLPWKHQDVESHETLLPYPYNSHIKVHRGSPWTKYQRIEAEVP